MNSSYFVHPTSIIDEGAKIGTGTMIWHFSHIMSGSVIGSNCTFGQNCFVANRVEIGDHCKIQNNVSIYEGVVLEDYVFCGPSMVFTNVKIPRCQYPRNTSDDYIETRVGFGASIGANATIVCGVTIGRHAFVAAGSVVTKDVPNYATIAGVPGKIVGWRSPDGNPLHFNDFNMANDEEGNTYQRVGDEVFSVGK